MYVGNEGGAALFGLVFYSGGAGSAAGPKEVHTPTNACALLRVRFLKKQRKKLN